MCQVQKLASKNRHISAASIALEAAEVKGQLDSAQTIRHTLQQVSLHDRRSRRKPLQKLAHKKACKQLAEDDLAKSMNYWNHVQWSDETKVNLFGSDGVQHVWWCPGEEYQEKCVLPTVKHGGVASWSGAAWVLLVLGSFTWIPTRTETVMMPSLQKLFSIHNHPKHNRYVSVEEWKRTPATACAALVNSMPSRIKAVLDNNGTPTKYWHFGHSFDVFT